MSHPPRRFLTAGWHHLAMLNFEVDPAVVAPFVPPGLEIDYLHGTTFLSMVGFRFLNTRVLGLPIPFHRNFDEVNLRCYVKRNLDGETRRGVVFIKELVPRRLVAWVARRFYNENYVALPMRSHIDLPTAGRAGSVSYAWQCGERWHELTARIGGEPVEAPPGSEQKFITEHYWGYSQMRDGGTMEYQVEHPRWRVWTAESSRFDCDVAAVYGPQFVPSLSRPPTTAFVADGSAIVVRRGTRIA
jgi:uncharacterized protein YqjF (DUF2071 family)